MKILSPWRGYFEWFPDYQIKGNRIFENGYELDLFGHAGGRSKIIRGPLGDGPPWTAFVRDERVTLWQVYAGTNISLRLSSGG